MPVPANSARSDFGEPDLRGLGGAVATHLRDAALPDDRRHDDQMARSTARRNDRQRGARTVERPHEVDVHHPLHRVRRRVFDRAVVSEAGIAHHDVEPAE